jgi:hypothetical protein
MALIFPFNSYTPPGADGICLILSVNERGVYLIRRYYQPNHHLYWSGTSKEIAKELFLEFAKSKDTFPFKISLKPELKIELVDWVSRHRDEFDEGAFTRLVQELTDHFQIMKSLIPFA